MLKSLFENELMSGMQQELRKQASSEKQPELVKAAECLHAALEIFEQHGMHARADQVLQLLEKLGRGTVKTAEPKVHSLQQLMEAGVSQRDLRDFARGEPRAVAKLNLVLRRLGMSEHEISKFLGPGHVMSEEQAHKVINPNEAGSMLEFESMSPRQPGATPAEEAEPEFLEFKSLAAPKKGKGPGRPNKDPVTKGWTPEKGVKALKEYGMPMKPMSADDNCAVDVSMPLESHDADFANLMGEFDLNSDADDLLDVEVADDSLEVSDSDGIIEDFEDEKDRS